MISGYVEGVELLARPELTARLRAVQQKHLIKVITGVRRGGKSVLLELFRRELISSGVTPQQLVVIDLDLLENESLREKHALHDYVVERLVPGRMTYVFIDEIQRCPHFEDAVESLYARANVDLYITGSNASLLSGDLATLLSGRYIETLVLPLSFAELSSADPDLGRYLRWGGFPELLHLPQPNLREGYLEGIFNTVLLRDVAERHQIRDTVALKRIATYLFENVGSLISANKIAGAFTSGGYKITRPTVENYISNLVDANLFYRVSRFDLRGKAALTGPAKYYAVDVGLRNFAVSYRGEDLGHLLENLVYLELLRRGYQVFVGSLPRGEIDFVATKDGITYYLQVCSSISSSEVWRRELAPFDQLQDHAPRFLLGFDPLSPSTVGGVPFLQIDQWLAGKLPHLP